MFLILKFCSDGFYHIKVSRKKEGTILKEISENSVQDWSIYLIKHIETVGLLCKVMSDSPELYQAAILHDIGKLAIPEEILFSKGKLDDNGWKIIKEHPQTGYNILKEHNIGEEIATIVLSHHERYDGTGYPGGLAGENIPLYSRMLSVADTYQTITAGRSYAKSRSEQEAVGVLSENLWTQFDGRIAAAFVKQIENNKEGRHGVASI